MAADPLVAPSVLTADLSRLGDECRLLENAGADRIHWDIMDGRFVPNLTFGPDVIASCRAVSSLPFEAHLMIVEPDATVERYVAAGCEAVIVHAEACPHLHRTLAHIRALGARAGVALNPHTPAAAVAHVLEETDLILAMTVNPGFGGQRYIPAVAPKIAELRALIDEAGAQIELEVDGGINDRTVAGAAAAGARVFVSGSWLLAHPRGRAAAVHELRSLALGGAGHLTGAQPV